MRVFLLLLLFAFVLPAPGQDTRYRVLVIHDAERGKPGDALLRQVKAFQAAGGMNLPGIEATVDQFPFGQVVDLEKRGFKRDKAPFLAVVELDPGSAGSWRRVVAGFSWTPDREQIVISEWLKWTLSSPSYPTAAYMVRIYGATPAQAEALGKALKGLRSELDGSGFFAQNPAFMQQFDAAGKPEQVGLTKKDLPAITLDAVSITAGRYQSQQSLWHTSANNPQAAVAALRAYLLQGSWAEAPTALPGPPVASSDAPPTPSTPGAEPTPRTTPLKGPNRDELGWDLDVKKLLQQANEAWKKGDLRGFANLVNRAACLDAERGGYGPWVARGPLNALWLRSDKAEQRGDMKTYEDCILASEPLLNNMIEWQPQKPLWRFRRGILLMTQVAHSDSVTELKMALKEFDAALACPGADAMKSHILDFKGFCNSLISQRSANVRAGYEQRAAGVREHYERVRQGLEPCYGCYTVDGTDMEHCGICGFFKQKDK